jgi:hypothetical protein
MAEGSGVGPKASGIDEQGMEWKIKEGADTELRKRK